LTPLARGARRNALPGSLRRVDSESPWRPNVLRASPNFSINERASTSAKPNPPRGPSKRRGRRPRSPATAPWRALVELADDHSPRGPRANVRPHRTSRRPMINVEQRGLLCAPPLARRWQCVRRLRPCQVREVRGVKSPRRTIGAPRAARDRPRPPPGLGRDLHGGGPPSQGPLGVEPAGSPPVVAKRARSGDPSPSPGHVPRCLLRLILPRMDLVGPPPNFTSPAPCPAHRPLARALRAQRSTCPRCAPFSRVLLLPRVLRAGRACSVEVNGLPHRPANSLPRASCLVELRAQT